MTPRNVGSSINFLLLWDQERRFLSRFQNRVKIVIFNHLCDYLKTNIIVDNRWVWFIIKWGRNRALMSTTGIIELITRKNNFVITFSRTLNIFKFKQDATRHRIVSKDKKQFAKNWRHQHFQIKIIWRKIVVAQTNHQFINEIRPTYQT